MSLTRRLAALLVAVAAMLTLAVTPAAASGQTYGTVSRATSTQIGVNNTAPWSVGYYTPSYVFGNKMNWGNSYSQYLVGRSTAAIYTKVSCPWWQGYKCTTSVDYVKLVRQ